MGLRQLRRWDLRGMTAALPRVLELRGIRIPPPPTPLRGGLLGITRSNITNVIFTTCQYIDIPLYLAWVMGEDMLYFSYETD